MLKRIYIYVVSFSVGMVVVFFIWNKKQAKFNYLPNTRVLNELYKKNIVFGDSLEIDTLFLKQQFFQKAEINFSKSQIINVENPVYFIENKNFPNIDYIKVKNYKSKKDCEIIEIKFNK